MRDLREYIATLEEHDQLEHVTGVDWDLAIGGISEIARRDGFGTALLFDDIPDYEPGYRILTNPLDTPLQFAQAFGYGPMTDMKSVVVEHKERGQTSGDGELRTVEDGPVLENVQQDDDIDITDFPALKWHENDGGRYIGTGDAVITRHMDTGAINAGTYRVQVHGTRTATVNIEPDRDGARNRESYFERGEPFPVVVSLGHQPDVFLAASERTATHTNELEYLSARRGEPLPVVHGEVTGLPFPAESELVFEGHVYPDQDTLVEGPFGEFTGYYGSGGRERHPFVVERVYHRDDPIVLGYNNVPIRASANSIVKGAATLWQQLEDAGVPGIDEVNSVLPGSWYQVISIEQQYSGHSTQAGLQAVSLPAGAWSGRITVVVDEDIDAFDLDEVRWAITTRFDPAEDLHVVDRAVSGKLDPRIHPERKERGDLTNSRAIVDATRPFHWRDEFPPDSKLDSEREAAIREEYGDLLDTLRSGNSP